jgi:hypothetical protein
MNHRAPLEERGGAVMSTKADSNHYGNSCGGKHGKATNHWQQQFLLKVWNHNMWIVQCAGLIIMKKMN